MLANICFTEKDKRKATNTGRAFSTLTSAGYGHTGNRQQHSEMVTSRLASRRLAKEMEMR